MKSTRINIEIHGDFNESKVSELVGLAAKSTIPDIGDGGKKLTVKSMRGNVCVVYIWQEESGVSLTVPQLTTPSAACDARHNPKPRQMTDKEYELIKKVKEIGEAFRDETCETPGGLEHMGDVRQFFMRWLKLLELSDQRP